MRNRPNLFEVINKAPQTQNPRTQRGFSWRRHRAEGEAAAPMVAEPLTEEEAAAELEARRVAAEEAARAKEAALREKRERIEARRAARAAKKEQKRAARQAAKAAAVALRTAADPASGVPPILRLTPGRVVLSLNTTTCIVAAAGICSLLIGAYSLGRRGAAGGPGPELAAVKNGKTAGKDLSSLVPGMGNDQQTSTKASGVSSAANPDLSALLKKPPATRRPAARANQPARVSNAATVAAPAAAGLNYLQIESFPISRQKSSERLKAELEDVRRFLAERGIKTFARRLPRGYALFAAQGFSPSKKARAQREAFQRKISRLGQAYRRAGGLYEFKGCFFVSYARATAGRPA